MEFDGKIRWETGMHLEAAFIYVHQTLYFFSDGDGGGRRRQGGKRGEAKAGEGPSQR